jgi:hypothetical protein
VREKEREQERGGGCILLFFFFLIQQFFFPAHVSAVHSLFCSSLLYSIEIG